MRIEEEKDVLVGTVFCGFVIVCIFALIGWLASTAPKMSDCEPHGGKLVDVQGRKVCLSKEVLDELRKGEK